MFFDLYSIGVMIAFGMIVGESSEDQKLKFGDLFFSLFSWAFIGFSFSVYLNYIDNKNK